MSDKSELKAELERKKQRLAQIREEKKRKEEERKKKEVLHFIKLTDNQAEANGDFISTVLICDAFVWSQADQLKDAVLHQDDSDLEKKRRETEALLQSMGITSEIPVGMFYDLSFYRQLWNHLCFIHHNIYSY